MICKKEQDKSNECINCKINFAVNYCDKCNLWTDKKEIFHCDKCKICRVGNANDFYHCDNCNLCFKNELKNIHICSKINCEENDCPICFENLYDNQKSVMTMKCKHPIHYECYNELIKNNNYKCPLCKKIFDLYYDFFKDLWSKIDEQTKIQLIPKEYDRIAKIYCYECEKNSDSKFHFLGLKCEHCNGFNTTEN